MVVLQIPSMTEIGAGIGHVANGACELASSTVQAFVDSPSVAQLGLNVVAAQIETLEQLVIKLRLVADGIDHIHERLGAVHTLEWHSPAGQTFRSAVGHRQIQARQLEATALHTARLAQHGIEDLRAQVAAMQALLSAARAAVGASVGGAIDQVCS